MTLPHLREEEQEFPTSPHPYCPPQTFNPQGLEQNLEVDQRRQGSPRGQVEGDESLHS